jgi:hypothetical protein
MFDPDTFLTTLYVAVDDCCKMCDAPHRRGPAASLSPSEVVTLVLFAQWGTFRSERAFYRYAQHHLREAFPTLPTRAQFNRLSRAEEPLIRHFFTTLAAELTSSSTPPYEIVDATAVPTRNVRRHGLGWLTGEADVGKSRRLGWYQGFSLLTVVTPEGVLTGFGFAPASTKEALLADTFLTARHDPAALRERAALAVGPTRPDYYIADGGFESSERQQRWWTAYETALIAPPRRTARASWPKPLRRWLATLRQLIETVHDKLHDVFRLSVDRPHALRGARTRIAAMAALHNFCIWLNRQLGRPDLAFVDLVDW